MGARWSGSLVAQTGGGRSVPIYSRGRIMGLDECQLWGQVDRLQATLSASVSGSVKWAHFGDQ